MKSIRSLYFILFAIAPTLLYSQKSDTAYYQDTDNLFAITQWDANKKNMYMRRWSSEGVLMDSVYCKVDNNQYVPTKNSSTYFSNGQLYKKFMIHDKIGKEMSVTTYDKNGKLIELWTCNITKNEIVEIKYYLNGNKRIESISKLPNRGNEIYPGLWYGGNNSGTIYQRDKRAAYKIIEYHPNGKTMCTKDFKTSKEGLGSYDEKFFDTTGVLDKSTFKEKISDPYRGSKEVKQGTWYSYYLNGQIEKKENYKDGKREGEQWQWYENGQLEFHLIITNGKYDIKEKYDKEGNSTN